MKKWMVAIICIMALCLAACCALADEDDVSTDVPQPTAIFTVAGEDAKPLYILDSYIDAGEYTGRYYYRLDFDSNLDDDIEIQMGFGSADSDAPDGEADIFPLSNVYGKSGKRYTFSFPDQEIKDYADAMFVRLNDSDKWQKYTFHYDQSKTNGAKATITNVLAPELNQEDFAVTWTAPDGGADAFYVHWEAPNGYHYPAFYAPGDATSLKIGPKNPDLVSRYCRDGDMSNLTGLTDSYGYYTIWIETLKDGCLTESDRWGCAISESAPLLMIDENGNDPEYVQKNDDGSVSVNLHQWINFKIYAPYAYQTDLYVLDNLRNLTDPDSDGYLLTEENRIATFWPDPDNTGWYDYKWYRNYAEDELTAFDQYLVAVSMYDGEPANNLISEPMTIHVSMDQEITGEITYSVVNEGENGIYQVARDGFLYVDVKNEGNNADWYGLYITEDGASTDYDPSWLADSHWFEKAEGKTTTRVRLSVPRCEAGQDYAVHVFGIKYGAKMAEAATTIPIHVVEKAVDPESPVTLNMEDSFITGEPLRVYAHYSNPNNYKGWMNIRIYNKFYPDDVIHDNGGSFENYWDVDSCGWHSGTYVVEAEIWENNQDEPTETYTLKEIAIETEDGAGEVADFELNAISSIGAGQELNVRIQTEPGEDAPEQYYVELVRLDSNGYYYDGKDAEPDENGWAEVRFDGGAFQPGSQFRVTVIGMKPGYDARRSEFRFAVTPDWTVQNLYLTVNGDDSPYQEIESSQNLRVEVGAEERPTAIRILNGDDWEYWYGDDENFTRDWGFGDGNTILYAEATWEDRNFDEIHGDEWNNLYWSSRSNVIEVHTESTRGRMKAPEFTIQDAEGHEKTEFALGQHLFVNITDKYPTVLEAYKGEPDTPETEGGEGESGAPETEDNTARPETDNWFFCDIFRVERNGSDIHLEKVDGDYDYPVQSGINCILTGNLEPGTYRIEIGADAVGYSGVSSYQEFTIRLTEEQEDPVDPTDFVIEGDITITDNQDNTSSLTFVTPDTVGKLFAPTFAILQMTAYHPDAEWYNVEITRQNDEDWHDTRDNTRGGMLRDDWRSPQTGIYTFTAYANRRDFRDGFTKNEKSGDWYCEIGTIVIEMVVTEEGSLGDVEATLSPESGWVYVGDPITLTFTGPENAEEYTYWIHEDNNWDWLAGDARNDIGEMTIDTNRLRGRGVYYLEADARATGYEESNKRLTFALLEEGEQPDENGFFSCSADYVEGEYHVGTGDKFRLMYFVSGADEVRLLDNYDNQGEPFNGELCGSQGPGLTEWRSFDDVGGEHQIYGMYRTGSVWSTPVELCTIKVFGKLGQPNVDMMWAVDADVDVGINFNGNENAESYDYKVVLEGTDPDDSENIVDSGHRETAGSMTISSSKLVANHVYRVYLDVNAEDYFGGHDERLLYVIGDETKDDEGNNGIWLNVPEEIRVGDRIKVKAGMDGAQDIFIRNDSDEEHGGNIKCRYGDGYIDDDYFVDNPDVVETTTEDGVTRNFTRFTAFARYDNNKLMVAKAEVTVTDIDDNTGYCAYPTITVNEDDATVPRNGFIRTTIGYDDGDDDETNEPYEYHVNIFEKTDDEENPMGNWCADYNFDQPGEQLVPTAELQEGTYLIAAWVRVSGKYGDLMPISSMATVTITECQEQFYVSKDTVEVCEPLTVAICAPGAERVRFSYGYGWDGNSEWDGDSWYSDNVRWEFSADEVDIVAEAMYNGEWQEIGRRHISITKRGDLDEPSIHVPDTVTAPAEQDLAITLDSVENGEIYGVNIQRLSDGWNEWYEANPDPENDNAITAVIPKEVLDEPNVGYSLRASVIGRGYNACVSGASFMTVPATVAEHTIILEADSDNAKSNQDSVKFTITAEDAKAVKIYHEGDTSYAPTDENGMAEIELGFNQDTTQPVWASAYYGEADLVIPEDVPEDFDWGNYWDHEYDWSGATFEGMSNIVYIRVHSDGPTQMPNWVNVPKTVAWGEWLPVEIGEGGNAEMFHIRIHETDGNEVYFMQVESNGTYDLPTTMLEPGSDYFVSICGMRPGCTWDDMEDYHFQVYVDKEGPDPKGVYITADKDKVFPYEPYHVIMHVPGAIELRGVNHEADEDVNFILDGPDAISDDCWWNEDQLGEQTLDIYAKYPGEDDETEPAWTEEPVGSVKLYVKNRQLEKAEIRVADVVDATSDITIQIPLVENGDHYILEVHNHNTPEWMRIEKDADKDAEEITPDGDDKEYVINYVIEAGTLNVGEPYWIDCYVGSNDDNFWMSDSSKNIMTADGNDHEGKITLSLKDEWVADGFNRYQIPINTNFEVAINNTFGENDVKPSAIAVYMGDYAEYGYYTGEGQNFTFREYQEWPETIFARAYYGDLSGYSRWEDVPLNQILKDTENWGKPTEPILVNFFAVGRVGEPDFGAPGQIFRGDDLTINIFDAGEGADETHANINCNDPDDPNENMLFGDNWVGWDEARHEIRLDTRWIGAGRYWLTVDNSGPSLSGNRRTQELEVFEYLEKPEIIVNSVVSNTGKRTIAVREVPHAQQYNLVIHRPGSDEQLYNTDKSAEDVNDGWVFFGVDANLLEEGSFWIDCYVNTKEEYFVGNGGSRLFMVKSDLAATNDEIAISVDRYAVPINQVFRVRVSAEKTEEDKTEQAKAIIVRCGDESWGCAADENGDGELWISQYQPGVMTIYAQAYYGDAELPTENEWEFDWSSLEWEQMSDPVTMRFVSDGPAGPAGFQVNVNEKGEIERGEVLVISNIHPGDGANEAHANISRTPPEEPENMVFEDWQNWDSNTRTIYLPTSMLEAGDYWLAVDNSGIGRENRRNCFKFTVTEGLSSENEIRLTVPEKVQTGFTVPINVYAPGAVQIGFGIDLSNDDLTNLTNFEVIGEGDSAYNLTDYRWYEVEDEENGYDVHTITAIAQFSEGGKWAVETATVKICYPLSFDMSGVPGKIDARDEEGANEKITIPLPVNAEGMNIEVNDEWDNGRETIYQNDEPLTDNWEFYIPATSLAPGHQIRIYYNAYAAGFEEVYGNAVIMVTALEGEGAEVRVRTSELDDIWANKPVEFIVRPTGENAELTAVRFFDGHDYWEGGDAITRQNHSDWFDDDGVFFWCNYNDEPWQVNHVFAEVQLNGSEEWISTPELTFTVKNRGHVGPFDFADDQQREITVVRGDTVTFHFGEAENATEYWLDAFDENDRGYDPDRVSDGTYVTMMTARMPAGTYRVVGRAGQEEWIWAESDGYVELTIVEPDETEEPTVNLSLSKMFDDGTTNEVTVLTQEDVSWSVYAPDATSISVDAYMLNPDAEDGSGKDYFIHDENNRDWNEKSFIQGSSNFGGHEGTAYIVATVTFDGLDEPVVAEITIHVTAPYGNLNPFKLRSGVYYGGSVSFAVEPDEYADWYVIDNVYLHYEGDSGTNGTIYRTPRGHNETGINGWSFDNIGEAHIGISVYQAAEGYNDCYSTIWMRPISTAATINLPNMLTTIEDEAFADNPAISQVIIPGTVTSIGNGAFSGCGNLWGIEIPSTVTSIGEGAFMTGNITIYGHSGSAAEYYAKNNDIDFVNIDPINNQD